jgi:hypothetical protein
MGACENNSNMWASPSVDTDPRISYRNFDAITSPSHNDTDRTAWIRELGCVVEQVRKYLGEAHGIGINKNLFIGQNDAKCVIAFSMTGRLVSSAMSSTADNATDCLRSSIDCA